MPVNPASLINVQPLDEGLLDGSMVFESKSKPKVNVVKQGGEGSCGHREN